VIGVLADSLELAALNRENRNFLLDDQLVLLSPYDPSAGFHVGTAMARNKLIYAFSDAALVVNSDLHKGGTWAGATEQLEKLHLAPVYVRDGEKASPGLSALRQKGALIWPEPQTKEELQDLLTMQQTPESRLAEPAEVAISVHEEAGEEYHPANQGITVLRLKSLGQGKEDGAGYRLILGKMSGSALPRTAAEIAAELGLPAKEAKKCLEQLVRENLLRKKGRPAKYFPAEQEFSF
ncbi:MAG TPA: DNA-processing protein DprA, partial [bacterium]|nr:DNA-processing protein DprA [bacterium]